MRWTIFGLSYTAGVLAAAVGGAIAGAAALAIRNQNKNISMGIQKQQMQEERIADLERQLLNLKK